MATRAGQEHNVIRRGRYLECTRCLQRCVPGQTVPSMGHWGNCARKCKFGNGHDLKRPWAIFPRITFHCKKRETHLPITSAGSGVCCITVSAGAERNERGISFINSRNHATLRAPLLTLVGKLGKIGEGVLPHSRKAKE